MSSSSSSSSVIESANTWIEVSKTAIGNNVDLFRNLVGPDRQLAAVVKANAYGHGMEQVAEAAVDAGVNCLTVFSLNEGVILRNAGFACPILVLGPIPGPLVPLAREADLQITLASVDAVREYARLADPRTGPLCHLKLETGTNRQGLNGAEMSFAWALLAERGLSIQGAYSHFADIEDTTDHGFATAQMARFAELLTTLTELQGTIPVPHIACSAAAILFPETYYRMVRMGIALYGLWPSKETRVSAGALGRHQLQLEPAMTWKTRIAQIKNVPISEYIGYGRTFRTTRPTRVGILPVGYADGYSRRFSGTAHTLVNGTRAAVLGRVCMNLTMIDLTDIPEAAVGHEVVLLGRSGDERVSAEDLAAIADTINYEIVTRAAPGAPRILV